jgi:hypothetical protein
MSLLLLFKGDGKGTTQPHLYTQRRVDLDVSAWAQTVHDEDGDLHKGFALSATGIPDFTDGSPAQILLDSQDTATEILNDPTPTLRIFYGYEATNVEVSEITDKSALVKWDAARGADYHVVEISSDGLDWDRLPSTSDDEYKLSLLPQETYFVRVLSVYEEFADQAIPTPAVSFTTAPEDTYTAYLLAPPEPAVEVDLVREIVMVTLPQTGLTNRSVDRWQISRRRDATTPTNADVIANISANVDTWHDLYPNPSVAYYAVRARIDGENDRWTPWSASTKLTAPSDLRTKLNSPNIVLELSAGLLRHLAGTTTEMPAVETGAPWRFACSGGDRLLLSFIFRSTYADDNGYKLRYGLRFYDKDSAFLSESYADRALDIVEEQPQAGAVSFPAEVPARAATAAIFFEMLGTVPTGSLDLPEGRVRVERLELYRTDETKDTGWEYQQIPDTAGLTPDDRDELVDESALTYDGVGWTKLADPPISAGATGPYRQTSAAEDEFTWITSGTTCELLYYGIPEEAVVELTCLSDDLPIQAEAVPEEQLWSPVIDDSVGTYAFGNELISNTGAETNTNGWTSAVVTNPNNAIRIAATLTRITSGQISGTGSFDVKYKNLGAGISYAFTNLFRAGHTYRITLEAKIANAEFGINLDQFQVIFGSLSPYINEKSYFQDATIKAATVQSSVGKITIDWTPRADTQTAVFSMIRWNPEEAEGPSEFKHLVVDNASCKEIIGYKLPAAQDFSAQSLKLPAWFSNQFPTPFKLRLISGTIRPYGIRRDPHNVLEYNADFATVLNAIGTIRNQTFGEVDLDYDTSPKKVLHYRSRGIDHSKIPNGLDLRYGKNIVANKVSKEPNQVVNRLILLGYGSDRTQLVAELRSAKDRQGRLPSDLFYRHDEFGRPPSDPDWDAATGGTSEDVYGIRYGVYRDSNIQSTHRANELGQQLVEISAWPAETFTISAVDVEDIPVDTDVGDLVPFRFRGEDKLLRIQSITTEISAPRLLQLTLGEPLLDSAAQIERVAKENEANLSFLNSATGAADSPSS